MVEYVGDSRIDGYPIVKVPRNSEGDLFLEYFNTLKDKLEFPIEVHMVSQLDNNENADFLFVKVTLVSKKFKEEFRIWKKNIRKQKLKQIDEYKD